MKKVVTFGRSCCAWRPLESAILPGEPVRCHVRWREANVAVSLANYGYVAQFVTRMPENDLAAACLMDLHKYGVRTDHVVFGGERLGIYFLETGAVSRPGKVVYDRAHSSMAGIRPGMIDWERVFEGASWFHWTGITPAISAGAAEACREAVEAANRMQVPVSCDLNYRDKLWKYGKTAAEVMPRLVAGCDVAIANEEDAEKVFGIKPEGFDAATAGGGIDSRRFGDVCRRLMERFPRLRKVAVTLRGSINASRNTWGGVLCDGRRLYRSKRYDITHIVDRVGGGDSFAGGLIHGLLAWPGDDARALEFAAAASCLKHTIDGDYNLVSAEEVERLMRGQRLGTRLPIKTGDMARFDFLEVLCTLRDTGMVPVFYHRDAAVACQVLKACYEGGVRAFEFTDRGDFACEVFASLVKYAGKECPEMALGVGSVTDSLRRRPI